MELHRIFLAVALSKRAEAAVSGPGEVKGDPPVVLAGGLICEEVVVMFFRWNPFLDPVEHSGLEGRCAAQSPQAIP